MLIIPPEVVKAGADTLGWRGRPYDTPCVVDTPVIGSTVIPRAEEMPETVSVIMSRAGGLATVTVTVLRRTDLCSDIDC